MSSGIGNAARIIVVAVVAILMIPTALVFMGSTMCAVSGGMSSSERIPFLFTAVVCAGLIAGGVVVIRKLTRTD
jgi:hypothetical protein